ncbi:MAG TPA: hypothetical protein PKE49_11110 [Leptospiraceae bacterium]|jgi:hypothetical protein|nr:hypothetical protein [Leptospirales bacterium]HMW60423.1 hypothetical protein [Leptospiraceae bacterium]HMX57063.1 hypothetical protein [Leptospiraceae bacterium]HMZ35286.1 hypothetical protein [Leptospiraceae bacterium]HNE24921.1 hypothetical protein [Leptospiraceae bacterium]
MNLTRIASARLLCKLARHAALICAILIVTRPSEMRARQPELAAAVAVAAMSHLIGKRLESREKRHAQ